MSHDPRHLLRHLLDTGLAQVSGEVCVARALAREPIPGPVRVVAVGKAADSMMRGAMGGLGGAFEGGLVIPKADARLAPLAPNRSLQIFPASHPLPDRSSLEAGQAMLEFVAATAPGQTLLVLVSGGASSLAEVLVDGVDLAQLVALNRYLLAAGLDIQQCNRLRQRLSRIKGGGLLRYSGTKLIVGLMISDVPGDDPAVIGSGLLVPRAPASLPDFLPAPIRAMFPDTVEPPLPGPRARLRVIADNAQARQAIARQATALGALPVTTAGSLSGDAAGMGFALSRRLETAPAGLYVFGGETTVVLPPAAGRGGRNQHLALAAAMALAGRPHIHLLACGSDGNDGPGPWAGALVDGGTVQRGRAAGLDPQDCLDRADAGSFLLASGDLVKTGPTGTNVSDLVLALIAPRDGELR